MTTNCQHSKRHLRNHFAVVVKVLSTCTIPCFHVKLPHGSDATVSSVSPSLEHSDGGLTVETSVSLSTFLSSGNFTLVHCFDTKFSRFTFALFAPSPVFSVVRQEGRLLAFSFLILLAHGTQLCNSLQSASILFPVSAESIFNIEELRLSKDPGYRHGARSNLGELVVSIVMSVWFLR